MPYYKITIWTSDRKKPFIGIRQYEIMNIDSVYLMIKKKAESTYRHTLIDIDVCMVSKLSTTIKKYLEEMNKKREDRRYPSNDSSNANSTYNRKKASDNINWSKKYQGD